MDKKFQFKTINSFAVCAFRFLLSRGTYVHLPSQENEIYSHPKRKNRPFILIKRTGDLIGSFDKGGYGNAPTCYNYYNML